MFAKSLFATAALAAGVMGQSSVNWTDTNSGIEFSYYETEGVAFGVALPETSNGDFIGYLASDSIDGYAAWSMTGEMANALLICAWVDGDSIVASLREATGYSNPPEISNSSMGIYEISSGTSVNSTGWSFTFLCKGCVTDTSISISGSDTEGVFGYAQSTTALTDTSSSDATLNFHSSAYGEYAHSLSDGKSSQYATWAALASSTNAGAISGTTSGSNTTTSGSNSTTTTTTSNSTYDYIVAGGGASGIIAAERLAESGASVLLLERGPASYYSSGGDDTMTYNDTITQYDVPAMAYYLTTAADTSEYCLDTAGMAGCLLGGSGAINAMMFVKPPAHDFDDKWPTGWKWDDVSSSADSFYERSPGYILANGTGVDQGAWTVMSDFLSNNGFSQTDALASPNEKEAVFSHPPWLIKDGLRAGPVKDYLPLAQAKSNFKMSLNTQLVRVVRSNTTATGVEVELEDGSRQIINLKSGGGVVLAGGALSTPRMLVNSGIGVKTQIEAVKSGSVSVTLPAEADWIELPVGKYIQDHPIFTVSLTTKDSFYAEPTTAITSPNTSVATMFNDRSAGLLAQPGQRLNFWTTVSGNDSVTRYIQGTVAPSANNTIKIKTYLTHGLTSHGVLEVTDAGATSFSTSCYLQTAGDISAITNWMNKLITMTQSSDSPFEAITSSVSELISTDNISEGDHYVGSARLGETNDGTSVVDASTMKVWGTDNIYVVDGSIHPDLPTGNSQAIIMVAAEKATSIILNGASSSSSTTTSSSSTGSTSSTGSSSTDASSGSTSGSSATASGSKKCKKRRAAPQLTL